MFRESVGGNHIQRHAVNRAGRDQAIRLRQKVEAFTADLRRRNAAAVAARAPAVPKRIMAERNRN